MQNAECRVQSAECRVQSAEFICHPEIASVFRRLYQRLRDLPLGAFIGLDFGKDSCRVGVCPAEIMQNAECRMQN